MTQIILEIGFRVLTLIGYVILAFLAIKRKKPVVIKDENSDYDKIALVEKVLVSIRNAESKYKGIFKEGVKACEFKLKDVLDEVKEYCCNMNIPYDKSSWVELISTAVDLINVGESKSIQMDKVEEALTPSAVGIGESKDFKFIGVNK